MPLDPEAAAFLERLAQSNIPAINTLPPQQARDLILPVGLAPDRIGGILSEKASGPNGDVPVRIYTPVTTTSMIDSSAQLRRGRPVVMFFHGGGWVIGSIDSHDALCRQLCNNSQCLVLSVEYRLAPEHKFPAGLEDCYAATQWAAREAHEFGGDAQALFVSGDSAGANLATAVCLMSRDRRGPQISGQVLAYPITDRNFETESYRQNGDGYFLTRGQMEWFWENYLADDADAANPYAAPLLAEDLSGLPDAFVLTAEYDPLRDEGLAYANRLQAAGVAVDRVHCEGMIHGFLRRTDTFDRANVAVSEIGLWLRSKTGL